MGADFRPCYRFASFRLDPGQRALLRDGKPVSITPKVFDLLLVLVENAGRLVLKQDLLDRVWPDTFVEEANLSVHISALRKILGDSAIETVPKGGYRFIAPVETEVPATETAASAHEAPPRVSVRPRRYRLAVYAFSLGAMAVAVGAVGLRSVPPRPFSLAIAPFDNPTRNQVAGPLVEDLTRAVAARLSDARPGLAVKVLRRSDLNAATGRSAVALGRSLDVDAILTGRIVQKQFDWTFETELVGVSDGSLLWTADYPATLTSVYAVEDQVAAEVARHLPIALSAQELKRFERHGPKNPKAQQLADRADFLMYQATPASLYKSIEYAEQAIALDPTYGLPYGQISSAYALLGHIDAIPPADASRQSRQWLQRARAVDSEIYTSHIAELAADKIGWDWSRLRQAGGLHPFYQDYLVAAGRVDEVLDRQLENVPDHPTYLDDYWRGLHAYFARRYDLAIQFYREALELDPGFPAAHLGLSRTYVQTASYDKALAEARAASELPKSWGVLGHALAVSGRQREARKLLDELTARARTSYVTPLNFAWIHLGLGEKAEAFAWLRKACDSRVEETGRVKADPIYDTVRSDPRFTEIVKCVGLEP